MPDVRMKGVTNNSPPALATSPESDYSYGAALKDAIKILGRDEEALQRLSNAKKATGYGFLTLLLVGIITAIPSILFRFDPLYIINYFTNLLGNIAITIAGVFIGYSIFHFIAKFIMGGQATGMQYFRPVSQLSLLSVVLVVPLLGGFLAFFAGIWSIVVHIFILRNVHKLATWKAVLLALLLPAILILLLVALILFALAGF